MRCAKCGRLTKQYAPKWAMPCQCQPEAVEWPCAKCAASDGELSVPGLFCGDNDCALLANWMVAVAMTTIIAAIRADKVVGKGTCSSIDECMEDKELARELARYGIATIPDALKWARDHEGLFVEQGLNQRWGEDDDPQLEIYRDFKKANKENPI